jgi:TatD DNase family protein
MVDEMTPKLVDFHCHLDLYPDFATAIADCERNQVYTLTVTTTPLAWPRNRELTMKSKYVRAALGLHPQLVADRSSEIRLWEEYFPQARYIGEVGLDAGPRYFKSFDLQKEVFQKVLKTCANAGDKIITVHSVRSAKHVLDMLEAHLPIGRGKVVLHWFTGGKSEARRALDMGCYFSINSEMLRNERHRDMIAVLPIDRLLTETDGPFTQIDGRPSRSSDVRGTVERLASVYRKTPDAMSGFIQRNLEKLVR